MIEARIETLRQAGLAIARAGALTKREEECVALMASGRSYLQIGHDLGITHRTARFHVRNAKDKANARSVEHLVALWMAARLTRNALNFASAGIAMAPDVGATR